MSRLVSIFEVLVDTAQPAPSEHEAGLLRNPRDAAVRCLLKNVHGVKTIPAAEFLSRFRPEVLRDAAERQPAEL